MRTHWPTFGLIGAATLLSIGCDTRPEQASTSTTQAASTGAGASATTAPANSPATEPRKRISLLAIPLTAEVPSSWDVQTGPGGRPVLHGRVPSGGDIDILLASPPRIRGDALAILLKEINTTATQPTTGRSSNLRTRVTDRNGLKMIEQIERMGPDGLAPEVTAYSWTVRYIRTGGGGNEFPVYELSVPDLSGVMVTSDQDFLRSIFESLQPDEAASTPVP